MHNFYTGFSSDFYIQSKFNKNSIKCDFFSLIFAYFKNKISQQI